MNPPEYTIRLGKPEDADLLTALGEQAFSDTFGKDNTPEDLAEYLRLNFSPQIQARELAEPGSIFLILADGQTPVGFVRLMDGASDPCLRESPDWGGLHAMELIRIYLLKDWTGRRLGDVLMQASLDQARRRGVEVLWLGVWEHNHRAIAFYTRWGFEKIGTHIFQLGQDAQTDFVMAQKLNPV